MTFNITNGNELSFNFPDNYMKVNALNPFFGVPLRDYVWPHTLWRSGQCGQPWPGVLAHRSGLAAWSELVVPSRAEAGRDGFLEPAWLAQPGWAALTIMVFPKPFHALACTTRIGLQGKRRGRTGG